MKAGQLSADLGGADLVEVRWGGLEVASAIQVTVRDDRWGTLRPMLRRADVREEPGAFSVDLDVVHGGDAFSWHGLVQGSADGTLEFRMDGVAERDFVFRRIGICVLHPWAAYVGARFTASGGGASSGGTFPHEIAPQPLVDGQYQAMIAAFHHLEVAFDGDLRADLTFEGESDGWELEDQRNWTDGSFKTYPTPLRCSGPRTIRRGERLHQRVRLRMIGRAPDPIHELGSVHLRVEDPDGSTMPSIGVTAPPDLDVDLRELTALGPLHLRVAVEVPGDLTALSSAVSLARRTEIPLEVALLFHERDEDPVLTAVVEAMEGTPVARVLLLRRSGATAGGTFVTSAAIGLRRLGPLPLAGGTASHFSELNRSVPDTEGIGAVALAMSPQVHAVDERSIVQTLQVQAQVASRVRTLTGGCDVLVSPVTLAAHDPAAPDEDIDSRVGSPFGAAWTVGSAGALASARVRSVTLHERADRTVLASAGLARSVRMLTERSGRSLHLTRCSDPGRVGAIVAAGLPPLVVNLTPRPLEVALEGRASGRRSLAPYEVAELERSPR